MKSFSEEGERGGGQVEFFYDESRVNEIFCKFLKRFKKVDEKKIEKIFSRGKNN